jgi:hypothetical protein
MKYLIWLMACLFTAGAPALAGSLPAAVIALPRGEHAILVEKQTQRFYIFRADSDSSELIRVFDTNCSTGEAFGPKQVEGDKKTPEGIYFIIDEHEDKDLTPIYGPRAFPTDYPHFLDRQQGKTGYAIWIHGTNKPLTPMDTNGCIALENKDVRRLSDYVTRYVTPVIIQKTIQYTNADVLAAWKTGVIRFVDKWVRTHMTGTAGDYMTLHVPGADPDRFDWDAWEQQRQRAAVSENPLQIQTSRMGIYRLKDTLVVAMDFALIRGQKHLTLGRRRLFLQGNMPESLWIAADEFQDSDRVQPSLAILAAGAGRLQESK